MPSGKPIDWSLYDQIIVTELPTTTITELANRLGLCQHSLGSRSKKLGIKPLKTIDVTQRQSISKRFTTTIPPAIKQFIIDNHQKMPRRALARHLQVSYHIVKKVMTEFGLVTPTEIMDKAMLDGSMKSARHESADPHVNALVPKHTPWYEYDHLLVAFLPAMTTEEFAKTHLPHVSPHAIRARARRLGIKPAAYHPTEELKHKLRIATSKDTPELIEKIRKLRDSLSLRMLAKECKIGIALLARLNKRHKIGLSVAGLQRAREASRKGSLGKKPWNKGITLPDEMKVKMAVGRQRMSRRLSQLQLAFYRILDEFKINYCREEDERCRFGHWTFDCRIIHGNYDFLVEVQGDYIHSQPKNISKDRAKATYMERYFPNIPIKYVWEHEFGASNRIKQQIGLWLELEQIEQIDFEFDNVTVQAIDEPTTSAFLAAFHYLGKLAGRIRLGAYLNGELIAASVWSAPARTETATRLGSNHLQCLELRRFVIHDAYHKHNFPSWLLSRMEKLLPAYIRLLVSFADPGMDHYGTIYKAANWQSDGVTEPSFFYADHDGYVMLKKTLFNLANKMHMKEADYAVTYGYQKVNTPPKLRFIKRR